MDFVLKDGEQVRTKIAQKGSSTVIEAGDFVGIASGLIIKATDSSAELAWCPNGAAAGVTDVEVTIGNDFTLKGTADANFAVTDRAAEVDLVVTNNVQLIDLGTSTNDVLKVGISADSGTVGSTADVEVRINKPIF
jgi:hypothetical protein